MVQIGTTTGLLDKPADIYIQDMSGKIIFQSQEWISDGLLEINLSNLSNGMYVLLMKTDNKTFNKKIVKN